MARGVRSGFSLPESIGKLRNRYGETIFEYIENRIVKDKKKGCWIWKKGKIPRYPTVYFRGVPEIEVHHLMYELIKKETVPLDRILRHTCDDSRCVNPDHLVPGTKKDNRRDFMERHPRAKEIMEEAQNRMHQGARKFWKNLKGKKREAFIKERSRKQAEKHPAGSEARIKAVETRRKNYPKGHPMYARIVSAMHSPEARRKGGESNRKRCPAGSPERHRRAVKSWETRRKNQC